MDKSPDAFRTISEVADWLGVQAHVLRFWESKFTQIKPVKRAGGRRYYRPSDMQLLGGIKTLLHEDGLTIKGVQKILREQGVAHVSEKSPPLEEAILDAEERDEALTGDGADPGLTLAPERDAGPEPEPEPQEASVARAAPAMPRTASPAPEAPQGPPHAPPSQPAASPSSDTGAPDPQDGQFDFDLSASPAPTPQVAHTPGQVGEVLAPDPPHEAEIACAPGFLTLAMRVRRLSPAQAAEIAPAAAALRDWVDRARNGQPRAGGQT
jgi:DNA-binding transcriptional MerR regulator